MIHVREDLHGALGRFSFEQFLSLGERVEKESANGARRTSSFALDGRRFYVKVFRPSGWTEIAKNLATLKLPVTSAVFEARALQLLPALEIPTLTLAAWGVRGRSPARRESFVVTEALEPAERLSELLARELARGGAFRLRRSVARALGTIARRLHAAGLVHQDLYLTHFLARGDPCEPVLHLIDLHRVQARGRVLSRWRVKDLAALYASALELPLTRTDLLAFMRAYRGGVPLRATLANERRFWARVRARALRQQARQRAEP